MSNIQKIMNDEIRRLARKEVKAALEPLTKAVSGMKQQIADLKKQLAESNSGKPSAVPVNGETAPAKPLPAGFAPKARRFSPQKIKRIRKSIGLSRKQFADLLDAYFVSVANWETGNHAPRPEMKEKIIALSKMSKRRLKAALEAKHIVPSEKIIRQALEEAREEAAGVRASEPEQKPVQPEESAMKKEEKPENAL